MLVPAVNAYQHIQTETCYKLYVHEQTEPGLVKAFNYWETIDGQGQHNHNILQLKVAFATCQHCLNLVLCFNFKMH